MVCLSPVGYGVYIADVSSVSPSSEQTKGSRSKRQLNTISHRRQTYHINLCYCILNDLVTSRCTYFVIKFLLFFLPTCLFITYVVAFFLVNF